MLMLSLLLPLAGVSAEPACLLQKPKAPTQLSLLAEMPVAGWEYAGKGDCAAILQTFNEPDPTSCASQCSYLMLAFSFDSLRSSTCFCCQDLALSTSYRSFAYARAIRKWDFIGTGKRCQSPLASFAVNTLNDCALSCEPTTNPGWFIYTPRNIPGCTCCSGLNPTTELIPIPRFSTPWSHFVYRREVKRVDVPGWDYAGTGACGPFISTHPLISSPQECTETCASATVTVTGFVYDVLQFCGCCSGSAGSDGTFLQLDENTPIDVLCMCWQILSGNSLFQL